MPEAYIVSAVRTASAVCWLRWCRSSPARALRTIPAGRCDGRAQPYGLGLDALNNGWSHPNTSAASVACAAVSARTPSHTPARVRGGHTHRTPGTRKTHRSGCGPFAQPGGSPIAGNTATSAHACTAAARAD